MCVSASLSPPPYPHTPTITHSLTPHAVPPLSNLPARTYLEFNAKRVALWNVLEQALHLHWIQQERHLVVLRGICLLREAAKPKHKHKRKREHWKQHRGHLRVASPSCSCSSCVVWSVVSFAFFPFLGIKVNFAFHQHYMIVCRSVDAVM